MRVFALSSPSPTHFMPAFPLLWALRAAGHEVVFAGQPEVIGMARGAGLPALSVGDPFGANDFFLSLPEGRRPIEAGVAQIPDDGWAGTGTAWVYHAKYLAPRYLEIARSLRPDLIVTDPLEYAGLVLGAVLDVPVVHYRWGPELMTPAGLPLARRMLRGPARRLGAVGDEVPGPALILDPFPSAWAIPQVPAGQPVRPVPYNGGGSAPGWAAEPKRARRVCVTLGLATVELNGLPLVRHIAEAFDGMPDTEAVITLDPRHQELLGPVPGNVRLADPAPLTTFIDTCDAVIHHGGAGTTTTTLMAGLPHLLVPQMMDQLARCAQMARSGAALSLTTAREQDDPGAVRAALTTLLEDPQYRETAGKLRAEAEQLPSPAAVTARLELLAAEAAHARARS